MIFPGTLKPFRKPGYILATSCNMPESVYAEYSSFYTLDEFTLDHLLACYYLDQLYTDDGLLEYGDMPPHLHDLACELVTSGGYDYSLDTVFFIDPSGVIHDVEFDLESLPTTHPELFL